ncbi:MAG: LytTR family DNA-binding domain-containing protein [Flammeovirgaceae bacterium]|nr:LytTR family DNA-binding domain-containing protein [Flammeovirgaceae bacterium]
MTILIIEDEPQAARRIEALVLELLPGSRVLDKIDSVKKSVQWFKNNPSPDLVLMDIQLADGVSFQIFEQVPVKSPVIFTTAYDEYALQAFKVNSIDYILKPVDKEDLGRALNKYKTLRAPSQLDSSKLLETIQHLTKRYKTRFMIKVGEHLKSIEVNDILFFFSLEKATFAQTKDGRKSILDFTLDQVQEMINPERFFRINRKYLIALDSIQDIVSYTNSRIKLSLKTSDDHDIIVARERVQDFKNWLDQ